ncbi:MAG: ATP-binding protein [Planctomycetota bacterium]
MDEKMTTSQGRETKISSKLILGFIGIASLVAVVGSVAINYNTKILFDVDQVLLANSKEVKAAAEVTYHVQEIHATISGLLSQSGRWEPERTASAKRVIGDSVSHLQQFNLLWEDAIKLGIKLSKDKSRKTYELAAFENLNARVDNVVRLTDRTVVIGETDGAETARAFFNNELEPLLTETQELARDFGNRTRQELMRETEQIRRAVNNSTWIAIAATITGLVAVGVIRYFINRTITTPISKLMDATTKIGRGDLETEIDIESSDEIGALARAVNDMAHKLRESYASLGRKVQQRTVELSSVSTKLGEEIAERSLAENRLQHHVKELNCLYGLSRLIERAGVSLQQVFEDTVILLRNAYQSPGVTCVRITFDGIYYKTDNFEKSELSQYAQIKVRGEKAGVIEVYYLEAKAEGEEPFLKAERDLLDAVAERLGSVAERKRAEEKLLLFRNLIEGSNDCIFVIEPKWGRFLDVNDRACDALGYAREELLKMAVKDVESTIPDDSSWQEQVEELRCKGDVIVEGRFRRKKGGTFFVETSLKLVTHEKEEYIIGVARDVTDRKQAEEKQARLIQELKTTNEKVESINQELKDFAYIVSHDLKAPLRGIKTLADWLSTDYADKLNEAGKEQMSLLLSRVGRMHNLIDGVLQYSRVGRIQEESIQANLNELMPEVIDMVTPPENIKITVGDKLPVIEYEQTRIMQVFENLLSNAIKYMDKPKGRIKIGCVEENGFWKFSVTDNGPGIEEKHFERIFRIFQTLSPRDEFESTGVGLTVIKKIVELHGGKIWLESKVGRGSTFFFTVPKAKKEIQDAKLEANIAC